MRRIEGDASGRCLYSPRNPSFVQRAGQWLLLVVLVGWVTQSLAAEPLKGRVWAQVVTEAESLGLPVKFLRVVPSDFVTFEFDALQSYAAEYHLGEHRMVLNRALSLNAAGGTLRPLSRLTHGELETLYHELFHAYMDYLATAGPADAPLLVFARKQVSCRYSTVLITPVVQRPKETEERFLNEEESWEALNEAWAVFIGWAVWNQLESAGQKKQSIFKPGRAKDTWLARLQTADREGKLRGYYAPQDPDDRRVAKKRFLSSESRMTRGEMSRLMEEALAYPFDFIQQASDVLSSDRILHPSCE